MPVVKITVRKKGGEVEIDTDAIPQDVYAYALMEGLKALVNRGASAKENIGLSAKEIAEKNVAKILAGKIRMVGQKSSKASGAVMTEARRIARQMIKDEIKAAGGKVSHYEASEITKAANELIEADASIVETAKANLETKPKAQTDKLGSILGSIAASPKLVAAAEAKKGKGKEGLSAKQAGQVAMRPPPGKGQAPQHGARH